MSVQSDQERLHALACDQPPFAEFLGLRVTGWSKDRVTAELVVRSELANRNGVLHGGAIMALADNLGGTATFLNLSEGASTTTLESKTNFFAAIAVGETVSAECTPLHRGRSTMVWQTRVTRSDGRLAAVVTQTQMIMQSRREERMP
jgi:1,4-dihydroxy-2-naphthoyl-CoA hydrolase